MTNSVCSHPDLEAKLAYQQEAEGKEFHWNREDVGELWDRAGRWDWSRTLGSGFYANGKQNGEIKPETKQVQPAFMLCRWTGIMGGEMREGSSRGKRSKFSWLWKLSISVIWEYCWSWLLDTSLKMLPGALGSGLHWKRPLLFFFGNGMHATWHHFPKT